MRKLSITLCIFTLLVAHNSFALSSLGVLKTLATEQGIDEEAAKDQLEAVISAIKSELINGREVSIRKFGKFYVQKRAARKGINPGTGAEIDIKAKRYPKFSSFDSFKDEMNK